MILKYFSFQTAIFCHHTPNVKFFILNWRTLRKKPVEEHFMFIPTSRFPAQSGQELLVVLNCSFQGDYFPIKPGHYPIRNKKKFIKDIFSMFCFHKKIEDIYFETCEIYTQQFAWLYTISLTKYLFRRCKNVPVCKQNFD